MKILNWSRVDLLVQAIFLIATIILWISNLSSFLEYQPFWAPTAWVYLVFALGIWQVFSNLIFLYFTDDWNKRLLLLAKFTLNLTPFPFSIPFWLISIESLGTTLLALLIAFSTIIWHIIMSYQTSQTKIYLHTYNPATGQVSLLK